MSILVSGQVVPTPAQLALDIELFHAHLETLEKADVKGRGACRSEAMQRSDLYKKCVKSQYRRIPELRLKEKSFLVDFFHAMRGHNFKIRFGWAGQKKTISKPELKVLAAHGSQFYGVCAVEDRLQGLNLSGNGCRGMIPNSVGDITHCKFLKLNWNRIHGLIPKTMRRLVELEQLHLYSNALEGNLDMQTLQSLTNLQSLNLSFNRLSGCLPDAFENLVHLREINLAGNKFTGALPDSMRHLLELETLKLYSNNFNGDVPEWVSTLTALKDVNLSRNKFKGQLDPFTKCRKLRQLILCHNQLEGPVPVDIGSLLSLEIFYASYNQLCGALPQSICHLGTLSKLNLSNNVISGILPPAFGDLVKLEICILGCNLIHGPAPLSMSKLKNLKDFDLFTAAPSETLYVPRAFEAHAFQRIFEWGPSVHLNNVHWEDESTATGQVPALSIDVLGRVASGDEVYLPEMVEEVFSPSISRWLDETEK